MSPFAQVSAALIAASFFGLLARFLRQPLLIGYLFAGLVLGAFGYLADIELLKGLGQLGITLLLFLVGIEMNLKELPTIGRVALATGMGQISFTLLVGYFLAVLLGFGPVAALYIAIALTFSSTIIIVKLLSEKRDLTSLYGKIAVGFLLVQDFVAVLLLVFLSGFSQTTVDIQYAFAFVLLKGFILLAVVYYLSQNIVPRLFDRIAANQELLYVASIAWALGFAALVASPVVGFSIEIGGFLAGLSLSRSSEHLQIASRIRPLRDFFITIFFLVLGSQLAISGIGPVLGPALLLSLFVLIGNPIIVMGIMGFLRYTKRTAFLASVTVAQISEFSFIVVAMGHTIGHIESSIVTLVTLVGVITMTLSTYLILYSQKIYSKIHPFLGVFETRKGATIEKAWQRELELEDHILILGCDRAGRHMVPALKRMDKTLLIVDHNPSTVSGLIAENLNAIFGDISDSDFLDTLNLERAHMVISTVGHQEDNLALLERLRGLRRKPIVIFVVAQPEDALLLYERGADYVVVPRMVAGDYLAHEVLKDGKVRFEKLKKRHLARISREFKRG